MPRRIEKVDKICALKTLSKVTSYSSTVCTITSLGLGLFNDAGTKIASPIVSGVGFVIKQGSDLISNLAILRTIDDKKQQLNELHKRNKNVAYVCEEPKHINRYGLNLDMGSRTASVLLVLINLLLQIGLVVMQGFRAGRDDLANNTGFNVT